jgi:nitrilase
MASIRVAAVQAPAVAFDTAASVAAAERWIAQACRDGATLVVLPEGFLGGYPRGADFGATVGARTAQGRELFARYLAAAVQVPGPETDRLCRAAARHRCELVVGVIERVGWTLYCSAVFISDTGHLRGVHRKLQPTSSERLIWGQGDGSTLHVFDTGVGRVGAAICWENLMPALRLALYAQGVEIWCAPTADARDSHIATMRHIAVEGRCLVVAANQYATRADYPADYPSALPGDPAAVVCRGGSVIVGPLGDVLAGPLYDEPGIVIAEFDPADIARARFDFDVVGHYARSDVFRLAVDRTERRAVAFHAHPDGAIGSGFTDATGTGARPPAGHGPGADLDRDSTRSPS